MQAPESPAPNPVSEPGRRAAPRWVRLLIWTLAGVCLPILAVPRLRNVMDFYRSFGRPPATSPIGEWLETVEVPDGVWIVNGLRSYIPAKYEDVTDGIWVPKAVDQALHRSGLLPAVYVESASSYDAFFSPSVRARGFNTPDQKLLHEQGAAFFRDLRRNGMPPFVLVGQGEETVGANAIHYSSEKFRIYANPLAFSANLADDAAIMLVNAEGEKSSPALPVKESGGLTLRWRTPVSAGSVHVATMRKACPDLFARLETADGKIETLPVAALGKGDAEITQRLLHLQTPKDVRALTLVSADGAPYAASLIMDVNVHPPVPMGLNPTRYCFELQSDAAAADNRDRLIAWRPMSHPGVGIVPGKPMALTFKPRIDCNVLGTTIVFDAAPAGICSARCTYVFADGSRAEISGTEERSLSPEHVYFRFQCPEGKVVARIECSVSSSRETKLRQVIVTANPKVKEEDS